MNQQRFAPTPSPETQPYWDACKQKQLSLPFCLRCEQYFFYPRPFCPKCFGWEVEWRTCSGRATLYTYAIQHRPQAPGFEPPYVTAIVHLEEGPRMLTNLIDVEPDPSAITCDMALEVTFVELNDEINLPVFRPANGTAK
jgi:uncharacterized OB-fold protein